MDMMRYQCGMTFVSAQGEWSDGVGDAAGMTTIVDFVS
jgi:hypothetical protein